MPVDYGYFAILSASALINVGLACWIILQWGSIPRSVGVFLGLHAVATLTTRILDLGLPESWAQTTDAMSALALASLFSIHRAYNDLSRWRNLAEAVAWIAAAFVVLQILLSPCMSWCEGGDVAGPFYWIPFAVPFVFAWTGFLLIREDMLFGMKWDFAGFYAGLFLLGRGLLDGSVMAGFLILDGWPEDAIIAGSMLLAILSGVAILGILGWAALREGTYGDPNLAYLAIGLGIGGTVAGLTRAGIGSAYLGAFADYPYALWDLATSLGAAIAFVLAVHFARAEASSTLPPTPALPKEETP
jgi:hypothetical protein